MKKETDVIRIRVRARAKKEYRLLKEEDIDEWEKLSMSGKVLYNLVAKSQKNLTHGSRINIIVGFANLGKKLWK